MNPIILWLFMRNIRNKVLKPALLPGYPVTFTGTLTILALTVVILLVTMAVVNHITGFCTHPDTLPWDHALKSWTCLMRVSG